MAISSYQHLSSDLIETMLSDPLSTQAAQCNNTHRYYSKARRMPLLVLWKCRQEPHTTFARYTKPFWMRGDQFHLIIREMKAATISEMVLVHLKESCERIQDKSSDLSSGELNGWCVCYRSIRYSSQTSLINSACSSNPHG